MNQTGPKDEEADQILEVETADVVSSKGDEGDISMDYGYSSLNSSAVSN